MPSVIGSMRPRTAALPAALRFLTRWRSAGILACPAPVNDRAPDSCDRNLCTIGLRVDAAEDGRAPGGVAVSDAL
ncbi:MAG: hypothetical protein ACP5MD_07715, partial [Verrucomicrobiia bacterium]